MQVSQVHEFPQLTKETLVTISSAVKKFPIPISRPTLERYIRRGFRGIRLKTCYLGGRRWTSVEEIERFVTSTQRTGDDVPAVPTPSMSKRDIDAAKKKHNLPRAGRDGKLAE